MDRRGAQPHLSRDSKQLYGLSMGLNRKSAHVAAVVDVAPDIANAGAVQHILDILLPSSAHQSVRACHNGLEHGAFQHFHNSAVDRKTSGYA